MNQSYHDPFQDERYPPPSPRTNTKSIASLALGVCSLAVPYFGLILGILAIVFARLSFKELRRSGEEGKAFAVAGLVCGIAGTVFYGTLILLFILSFLSIFNIAHESF